MCSKCYPSLIFSPCDICAERRRPRLKNHFINGRLTREEFECLSTFKNANEHEQQHSNMLDVCVDREMLRLVEYVNSIGVPTSFSCITQEVKTSTPGIVVKALGKEYVFDVIKSAAPDFHELIRYHEWLGTNSEGEWVSNDVTLYFPDGVPKEFNNA